MDTRETIPPISVAALLARTLGRITRYSFSLPLPMNPEIRQFIGSMRAWDLPARMKIVIPDYPDGKEVLLTAIAYHSDHVELEYIDMTMEQRLEMLSGEEP